MSNDEKLKAIFSNLGRATLRGIRKCPKCGTFNGTRGVSCKNKKCDVVFKEIGSKRKLSSDAVKLLTGSTTQVYSVRVRDRGPDYRGFVQLPYIIQTHLKDSDLDPTLNIINESAALCFVDTCQRSFDTSILKCHEEINVTSITSCAHVLAAIKCASEATPLIVRNSILSSLNVTNEIKQELWLLATETVGPLVQRVSKNIMAVKCQTSPKDPLGYLHLSFSTTKTKDRVEHKYFCGCADHRGPQSQSNKPQIVSQENRSRSKCIHYYACICAFASDSNLSEEFDFYVSQEKPFTDTAEINVEVLSDEINEEVTQALNISEFPIFNTDLISNSTCNIELLTDDGFLDVTNMVVSKLEPLQCEKTLNIENIEPSNQITILRGSITDEILNLTESYNTTFVDTVDTAFIDYTDLKRFTENVKPAKRSKNNNLDSSIPMELKKSQQRKPKIPNLTYFSMEESNAHQPFLEWLSSVTETINQTMHYLADGKPDPIIFSIPQHFFECLRDRISLGFTKKRLPNFTQVEIRRDKPPFGTFVKYVWHIINIFHVKQIFETPLVSLEITQTFSKNKDGTYSVNTDKSYDLDGFSTGFVPIKPLELKTYLKVGNTSANQNEPTPFIIEWTPDILPVTKIGELVIKFEFGHIREVSKGSSNVKGN